MEVRFPDKVSNSRLALEATEFAKAMGRFDEFHRGIFRAYWVDTKNIGDIGVVLDVAEGAGLDMAEVEKALNSGKFRAAVDAQLQEAADLGIFGVPTFIFNNKFAIQGAVPYSVFQRVMAKLAEKDMQDQS